ncbi:MAG: glutamate-1-semialdehyde 2,1-aminomutase [Anaerolineales bacterium]|nr:glutamate-1-semialdehyde 2,1-aminomutase [Anaerolineales bacterium]
MSKSTEMWERSQKSLAGGVGSVSRSPIAGFTPHPTFFEKGKGSRIWDVDGKEYIDYTLGFGPTLLGHCHPELNKVIIDVIENKGTSFGQCHELEYLAAERIVKHMPSIDMVRFGNSGTEVVMLALRLARGFTGKEKIVRFEGHYHGWSDVIHWNVRSPLGAIGMRNNVRKIPGTSGIAANYGDNLIVVPWNDPEALEEIIDRHRHEIAAVITEPLMCNLGATAAKEGYLEFVRKITKENDILLIFDEVITAFRVGLNGAQGHYNITPDITTMAKALGGGYPVAAFGARAEIMELVAHHVVSHAGTYNSSPLSMAAVVGTMDILEKPGIYENLHRLGDRLRHGLVDLAHQAGFPAVAQGIGPIVQLWFEDKPIVDYRDAMTRKNMGIHNMFAKAWANHGVLANHAQFGVWYISVAHSDEDIEISLEAASKALEDVKAQL